VVLCTWAWSRRTGAARKSIEAQFAEQQKILFGIIVGFLGASGIKGDTRVEYVTSPDSYYGGNEPYPGLPPGRTYEGTKDVPSAIQTIPPPVDDEPVPGPADRDDDRDSEPIERAIPIPAPSDGGNEPT
jgi:hypothetical protein